ncbi:MAG: DUF3458 domain-containing protein, partial [Pseudomonadota bacterium]
ETATDRDYALIEAIIAHEYFHNWTGNRITCRDWFQLCLKEGLTVFRDQQFSADMRSAAVCRIDDVKTLRARQFREDAGPLAHPVRPEEYIEINNFYTATVYEKGAEVIGMLRRIVGSQAYDKALSLYFDRHDGQACTIEQWLTVFEDATGSDLSQFALWYAQAGTPKIKVTEKFQHGVYTLTLSQSIPDTPGQSDKKPMTIPISYGLIGPEGEEMVAPDVITLTKPEETYRFELYAKPVPSLLRGFSAPVILEQRLTDDDRARLMAHDTDPFNRWEAGRKFAMKTALSLVENPDAEAPSLWLDAMAAILADTTIDDAFKALLLELPGQDEISAEISREGGVVDPDAVFAAARSLEAALATQLADGLHTLSDEIAAETLEPTLDFAGRRALGARALWLSMVADPASNRASSAFAKASNMTDTMAALRTLLHLGLNGADDAFAAFSDKWASDELVLDKARILLATNPQAGALDTIRSTTASEGFAWSNPNRFRSLIGAFAAANPVLFHAADGSGYTFFADWLIKMDEANPQTAARVAGAFETWRRYDPSRQALMSAEMERVLKRDKVSKDMAEILDRILAA